MAPRCKLVSLKVLDDSGAGRMSAAIQALEWIRQVNADAGKLLIHGVNLGLGYEYDPE
jgi:serine protease AprX